MKKIKIFIGSSIVEFKNERQELENFIHNLSNDFIDKYEIMIIPFTCEAADNAMARTRKQDEYNKQIAESEMCFFLFFTRAGEYTIEELNYAFNTFKSSEQGKPKVYVYFKIVRDNAGTDDSIENLKQILDKNYGHFFSTFESLDTVKLRILLNLKFQEMNFLSIEVNEGQLLLDGKPVSGVEMSGVGEFANNGSLQELESRLKDIEKRYYELLPMYRKGDCSDEVYKEFCDIAGKRSSLKEQIEDQQKQIFELSLRLSQDDVKGEMTPRMRVAYRLLERGDTEGCLSVLNQDDIDSDFEQWEKKHEEQGKKKASIYIREHMLAIDTLMTMYSYKNRNQEIVRRYEKVTTVAKKYNVNLELVISFANYLYSHQQSSRALSELESLIDLDYCSDAVKAEALDNYASKGEFLHGIDLQLVERRFREALGIWERLGDKYFFSYLDTIKNLVLFLDNEYGSERSAEAIEILEAALARANSVMLSKAERGLDQISMIHYGNLIRFYANLFAKEKCYTEAEKLYKKEVSFFELTAKHFPGTEYFLSYGYEGLADYYNNYTDRLGEAEEYYVKAIENMKLEIAHNQNKTDSSLADLLEKLATVYSKTNQIDKAEQRYLEALEIMDELYATDPSEHGSNLAVAYYNVAGFYLESGRTCEAERMCIKALNLSKQLTSFDFEQNAWLKALVLLRFAEIDMANDNTDSAEKRLIHASELLLQLETTNMELFHPILIRAYSSLLDLYRKTKQQNKAEEMQRKIGALN